MRLRGCSNYVHCHRNSFLAQPADDEAAWRKLRMSETSGRPLGSEAWLAAIETRTGRALRPQKRGPKPRERVEEPVFRAFSKLAP